LIGVLSSVEFEGSLLDTRSKIVDAVPSDARRLKIVVGYFDPMHAGHVRRLRELCADGEKLIVFVADLPEPILPTRARAELVAALDCVAHVIEGEASDLTNVIDERSADMLRSREFAQHVLARHQTT
jgi:cytidyltransferase-like protein